ncbi:MAG: tetratricopeptide repeat protein [Hormoscilla sp. SP5CHS1]|nr:tetratricopeptide repeat protein [Hormoscilla sp. SP12CHS1]MBC6455149.1 tetratricopeptide repeat protein [Hormoscilla sp. SP5CHS1]
MRSGGGRYPGSWGFVPVAGPFRVRAACHCCQRARKIALNPVHFGALHGLGLCHAALGEDRQAIGAFRRALEIQPYENQRLILAREENIKTVLEIGS